MAFVWQSSSEEDTVKIGKHIAAALREGSDGAVCLCMFGNLGAGKSVLSRAIIRGLTGDDEHEVPSPTYTIVQLYDADQRKIYHFDLYRLEEEDDIFDLGWDDAMAEGIALIEWPERLGHYTPKKRIDLRIDAISEQREVTVKFVGYPEEDSLITMIEKDL